MKIADIMNQIDKSTDLTPQAKARLIRLCCFLRAIIQRIHNLYRAIRAIILRFPEFCEIAGFGIILAVLVSLIPAIGQFLGTTVLVLALCLAILKQLSVELNTMFDIA